MRTLAKVSVVIPTRNAEGPLLENLVEGLNRWVGGVGAVILVDSESTDRTVEYIREALDFSQLQILHRPRGLYASWNFALTQVRTKYAYIATVGDVIAPAGVSQLLRVIERYEGDIAISPPDFRNEFGDLIETAEWPIHRMIDLLALEDEGLLDSALVCAWHSLFFPATLIGSSASNLYRTEYLQRHPFPLDYENKGDSAWAIEHSAMARWCLCPKKLAQFVYHQKEKTGAGKMKPVRNRLHELLESVSREKGRWCWLGDCSEVSDCLQMTQKAMSIRTEWQRIRSSVIPWYFFPRGWRVKAERKRVAAKHQVVQRAALQCLKSKFGEG